MKNRFLFSVLLLCAQTVPASAEYRNDPTDEEHVLAGYRSNGEYMASTLEDENLNGYALTAIGADKAYTGADGETAYGDGGLSGSGVTIGFLTPFGITHEDFENRISTEGNNGSDDYGWGTKMAGVMAAGMNEKGMHGVAYNATILPLGGMASDTDAYAFLANETYDPVKIITAYAPLSSNVVAEGIADWSKDRLFINANDNVYLASWLPDSGVENNVINVASYDPRQTPGSDRFIGDGNSADYFATGVEKWTLAAPGNFYVPTTTAENQSNGYAEFSSSDLAAAAVAGAAALVQEAFPTINGKLIADILFSTAIKEDDLTLSPYMIQDNYLETGVRRILAFTDTAVDEAISAARWEACAPGSETCFEERVSFEEVFGQGLLNVAEVAKGPKYFDAERSDYDSRSRRLFYTVDMADGVDWTWSHNIGQKLSAEHAGVNVGLKKQGDGTLTLSGSNTFEGDSVVEGGKLVLTGSMISPVTVNGGSFLLNGGSLTGNLTVNTGSAVLSSGTMNGGTMTSSDGEITLNGNLNGRISNIGTLRVDGDSRFDGKITNSSSGTIVFSVGKSLEMTSDTLDNSGKLIGTGTITGVVNNTAEGSVGTSLQIGTLNSAGTIVVDERSGLPVAMRVTDLNITGGSLSLKTDNKALQNGDTYTIIDFRNLINFSGFEQRKRLSDFISIVPVINGNLLQAVVEYLPLFDETSPDDFSKEERKVLEVIDDTCIKQKTAGLNRIYFYTPEQLKKQVEKMRTKILPVHSEQLPLNNVMASQVHAHLFSNNIVGNAAEVWKPRAPKISRTGRSGGQDYTSHNRKLWGQMLGGFSKEEADKSLNREKMTTRSVGAMFGYDYEFSEHFLLGVLAGTSSAKIRESGNQLTLKDYRAGLYTSSRFGQVTLNTVLTGGFQKYDSMRFFELFGENETGIAKYDGYSAEFDVNLGVDFMRVPYRDYSFFLRSYVSANVNYLYHEAYKEKGGAFLAMGVNSMHNTAVSVSPGITLGYNFYALTETVLTADFSYQRLVHGERTNATAYLLADTEKTVFSMSPVDSDKKVFNAGLGLKTKLGRSWQLYLYAAARTSKRTEALNLAATFSYTF